MTKKSLKARGFRALLVTLFLGAANDNLFRIVLSLLVVDSVLAAGTGMGQLIVLNIIFSAPYLLFSGYAGLLADRFSKRTVIIGTKFLEVFIMVGALLCYWQGSTNALLFILFLLGLQSALFSPSKYGILPEILEPADLSRGNGRLEFWTMAAIITGTAAGGIVKEFSVHPLLPGLVGLSVALAGLLVSVYVPRTVPQPSEIKKGGGWRQVLSDFQEIRTQPGLFRTVVGQAFFWFAGSFFQLNAMLYSRQLLGWSDAATGLLLAVIGVGLGVGSLAAGRVSAGKVELGLVPLGGLVLTLGCFMFSATGFGMVWIMAAAVIVGLGSGFFIVPLNAYIQDRSPAARRGAYIAVANVLSFIGIMTSPLFLLGILEGLGWTPAAAFFLIGLAGIGITIYLCWLLPDFLLRCLNWIAAHTIYRLRVFDSERVPRRGGALLVCNHVSYVDAALLLAALDRPVRFLMYQPIYELPFIKPVARALGAIPVPAGTRSRALVEALATAREAIAAGELVCIFPEGSLTRIGTLLPFGKGLERIMKGQSAPIIPVYLDQVWGSIFSFRDGRFFWKRPRQLPYPVSILFGEPLAPETATYAVRVALQELSTTAFTKRHNADQVLPAVFIRTAKQNLRRRALDDSSGTGASYGELLTAALLLARRPALRGLESRYVGILLPPGRAGVIANLAVYFAGGIPVNLNYTLTEAQLAAVTARCRMPLVLTARRFRQRVKVALPVPELFLEDLAAELSGWEKVAQRLLLSVLPTAALCRIYLSKRVQADTVATVLFSSGSTGEPKGVLLSHSNIMADLSGIYDVMQLRRSDVVLGVLPFFHSFGLTGTLWLPLLAGLRAVYHYNPLEAEVVGSLAASQQVSILMATPTFLARYTRKCSAEQFKTLRLVIVGAEKLRGDTAEAFAAKFGLWPLEGYGATELSPVAAVNVPDYPRVEGDQIGYKAGTVGHPLPGVAARVVDPDTLAPLPPDQDGLLLIKGANVMLGYLDDPERTADVLRAGWYHTGDIARLDEAGFLTITDRLARFSKIGGEMVPHGRIEEELQRALGECDISLAVTAVSDEVKGERLVVLSTAALDVDALLAKLSAVLPNLWLPKRDSFLVVPELPLLGTGKLDLKAIKTIAAERCRR